MKTKEYNKQDTQLGKLCGLLLIIVLCLFGSVCRGQNLITEDYSDYKPAPETISSQSNPIVSSSSNQSSNAQKEVLRQNTNPVAKEVKSGISKELKFIGKLCLGILTTAIIIKTTNATNAIVIQ